VFGAGLVLAIRCGCFALSGGTAVEWRFHQPGPGWFGGMSTVNDQVLLPADRGCD
jgi:hypothetical protein